MTNIFNNLNNIITPKLLHFFIAIIVAVLTTGFLRLQLFSGFPESDGGLNTFINQYIYYALNNSQSLKAMTVNLYQLMTHWVYALDVHQFIVLRLIDGLLAIIVSIILFKVILKESDSILFTIILMIPLLILMNNVLVIGYGYKNSIWAAYLPLFTALLIWQKSSKEDTFSFYIIGALVSFGVLLREPFLPFFLLAGVAIFTSYGWRVLLKYLIGSAILGFSVLAVLLSFRGWDLLDLIDSYTNLTGGLGKFHSQIWDMFFNSSLRSLKANWFICITALASIIYFIKLYAADKKSVCMNRFYFWLLVALIPLIEPMVKVGFEYHLANCLPGLAGLSAMSWRYINNNESKQANTLSLLILGLMSLFVIVPSVNQTIVKSGKIYSPSDAIYWSKNEVFRSSVLVQRSQYLNIAAEIYERSREGSTLVITNSLHVLYPLTGLLPPVYELSSLNPLYSRLNQDEEKLIKIIKKHRPTIIATPPSEEIPEWQKDFSEIIEKTNLYNKVAVIPKNLAINYGWRSVIIYRLKDFK